MRYEVRHYTTEHTGFTYDALICFERDGLVKSMAYMANCYPAHIVVEATCDNKIAMAYMVDSQGRTCSFTLVHICEVVDKYTVLRRLAEQICEDSRYIHSWQLECDLEDMLEFVNVIMN